MADTFARRFHRALCAVCAVCVASLALSCGEGAGAPAAAPAAAPATPEASQETGARVAASGYASYGSGNYPLSGEEASLSLERFSTKAHERYLSEPLAFSALPDGGQPKGRTAVVGSRVCLFYPVASIASSADLAKLPAGESVPFGTILPIGDKFEDGGSDRIGMFEFQDNWNYFFATTWKGRKGIVFGADLFGLADTNEANRVSSMLYLSGGRSDAFYPVTGYAPLEPAVAKALERDRLAFQAVDAGEYQLHLDAPDDMLSLYSDLARARKQPVFVTTDLAAHASHLVFDRLLQYVEEEYFFPRLVALTDRFIAELSARQPAGEAERTARDKAVLYFQTARALLALAPSKVTVSDEYGREEPGYEDVPRDAALAAFPEAVRVELSKMDAAAGFEESAVLAFVRNGKPVTYLEDYSQYKPRGHYTKNGVLSAYFRAMMWYGRIHFLIAMPGADPYAMAEAKSSSAQELTLAMEPVALLIAETVRGSDALYKEWEALFDPVTDLIGLSDDLGLDDVLPLWNEKRSDDFNAWASSDDNLTLFMEAAHKYLRPPAVSGSSVFWGPSEGEERRQPMGFRLFGQRFTYDSAVHQLVSPPRLITRDMVRGLDVMKAFGSRTAERLLAGSDYADPRMGGAPLKERLDGIEASFAAETPDFWSRTYYSNVLHTVKTLACFEPGAGFYFTESPAWGVKAMNSAHGAWAELRHDTILYVKQVYAERAGDGDYEPTYRTEPVPEPVHYVEPNVPFWDSQAASARKLYATLAAYGLLDEESARVLSRLHELYGKAGEIARLEAEDAAVPPADLAWIRSLSNELRFLVLVHVDGGAIDDPEQLRMALVADVFTNVELGLVLETAVGLPRRIYVPLNDAQGGKRIAVGYSYSYYEFHQPMGERMTDEEWKALVYADKPKVDDRLPFWARGTVLPSKAASSRPAGK